MKLCRIILCAAVAMLASAVQALAQQSAKFNADYSTADIRVDAGVYMHTGDSNWNDAYVEFTYTRQFWNRVAYRAGVRYVTDAPAYDNMVGIPLGIAYRPYTVPLGSSLLGAAEMSVYDVVRDGYYGRTDRMGSDILTNFIAALFRRTEYFVGLTPGWFGGEYSGDELQHQFGFSLTADVGFVVAIPIRHVCINITPVYHYSLTDNFQSYYGKSERNFFSFAAGLSYMF